MSKFEGHTFKAYNSVRIWWNADINEKMILLKYMLK